MTVKYNKYTIFIVGPTRSGTELIRSMLNRHPEIYIAAETHYFDDLRPRVGGAKILEPADRARVSGYFNALIERPYGFGAVKSASATHPDEFNEAATADEMFAVFCRQRAAEHGKIIWGEKTPRHIFCAAEIYSVFPEARLVAMVRDPRAVVASYRDWRQKKSDPELWHDDSIRREARRVRASYSLTMNSLLWMAAVQAAEQLTEQFGSDRVHLLNYETLVANTDRSLRELCAWLDLDFARPMAEVEVVNSTYLPDGMAGLQASPLDRWAHVLSSNEIGYVQWLTQRVAKRHGYESCNLTVQAGFAASQLLASPFHGIRALLANRERVVSLPRAVVARLRGLLNP